MTPSEPSERDKRILELSRKGKTRREIAEELGCSISTVNRAKQSANRSSASKLPEQETEERPEGADELAVRVRDLMIDHTLELKNACQSATRRLNETLLDTDAASSRAKDYALTTCMLTDKILAVTEAVLRLERSHGKAKPQRAKFSRRVAHLKPVTESADGERQAV